MANLIGNKIKLMDDVDGAIQAAITKNLEHTAFGQRVVEMLTQVFGACWRHGLQTSGPMPTASRNKIAEHGNAMWPHFEAIAEEIPLPRQSDSNARPE